LYKKIRKFFLHARARPPRRNGKTDFQIIYRRKRAELYTCSQFIRLYNTPNPARLQPKNISWDLSVEKRSRARYTVRTESE
jgi:hypothetical protein